MLFYYDMELLEEIAGIQNVLNIRKDLILFTLVKHELEAEIKMSDGDYLQHYSISIALFNKLTSNYSDYIKKYLSGWHFKKGVSSKEIFSYSTQTIQRNDFEWLVQLAARQIIIDPLLLDI